MRAKLRDRFLVGDPLVKIRHSRREPPQVAALDIDNRYRWLAQVDYPLGDLLELRDLRVVVVEGEQDDVRPTHGLMRTLLEHVAVGATTPTLDSGRVDH